MECDLNLTYPPFKLNWLRTTGPWKFILNAHVNKCDIRAVPGISQSKARAGKTLVRMFGTYKNHITEEVKLMGATTSPSIGMCFEAKLFGRLGLKFGPRRKCSHCPLDNPVPHVKYTGIYERLSDQFKLNFDQISSETI